MNKNALRLRLEQLEERWQPAILLQLNSSGNLTSIFGTTTGTVVLTQVGDNQFDVVENGNDLGTYNVPGNLKVSLGNSVSAAPALIVDLGGFEFGGSMDLGVGNATAGYEVMVANGTIDGNLNVTTGNGPDMVFLGGGEGGAITVDGNVSVNTANGADTVSMLGSTIDGNVTVRSANAFTTDSEIGGFLTYDSSRESLPNSVDLTGSDVAGSAIITTGAGADTVTMGGNVSGHAIVNLGNGANALNVDGTVLGNMTVTAGSGNDVLDFGGGGNATIGFGSALIGGNLTVVGGNGLNQVTFTNTTVLGNSLTYVGGNGVDLFTVNSLTAPGARLTGIFGNGNDVVTFNTLPVLASAYLDGGFGRNTFNSPFAIDFPIVLRNFTGFGVPPARLP